MSLLPFYNNEYVTLYHGDCLEVMPELIKGGIKINSAIIDPPYTFDSLHASTTFEWDKALPFDKLWENLEKLLEKRGSVCIFGVEPFSSYLRLSKIDWYKYDWIWDKNSTTGFVHAKSKPLLDHELISVFSPGVIGNTNDDSNKMIYYPQGLVDCYEVEPLAKKKFGGAVKGSKNNVSCNIRTQTNYPRRILHFSSRIGENSIKNRIHPSQKSVGLLEYLVRTYSKEGELLFDCCAGSGSLGEACMRLKRRCILIEKELEYCEKIKARLSNLDGNITGDLF